MALVEKKSISLVVENILQERINAKIQRLGEYLKLMFAGHTDTERTDRECTFNYKGEKIRMIFDEEPFELLKLETIEGNKEQ